MERIGGRGVVAVLVATLAWSAAPVLVKSSELTGLRFAMFRLWAGVGIYALILAVTGRRLTWSTLRRSGPGGIVFGLDVSLAFLAFTLTSVADATIIGALSPVVIALASTRLLGERIGRVEVALAVASFGGVVLVALGQSASASWSLAGDLAALAGIGTWTVYWFWSRRARRSVPAIEYMTSVMLAAAVVVTPIALLAGGGPLVPDRGSLLAVALVALVPGVVGHTLVAWSHEHVASWLAALVTQCHPVFATVWAWWFLGERLEPLAAVGIAVVLAATGGVIVRSARTGVAADLEELAEPPA
ncbi:MAG: EamA family transporter [Actinomycetota bacterium]|nr:MAG: EamA family transporter [Actinomycetota bacterium]